MDENGIRKTTNDALAKLTKKGNRRSVHMANGNGSSKSNLKSLIKDSLPESTGEDGEKEDEDGGRRLASSENEERPPSEDGTEKTVPFPSASGNTESEENPNVLFPKEEIFSHLGVHGEVGEVGIRESVEGEEREEKEEAELLTVKGRYELPERRREDDAPFRRDEGEDPTYEETGFPSVSLEDNPLATTLMNLALNGNNLNTKIESLRQVSLGQHETNQLFLTMVNVLTTNISGVNDNYESQIRKFQQESSRKDEEIGRLKSKESELELKLKMMKKNNDDLNTKINQLDCTVNKLRKSYQKSLTSHLDQHMRELSNRDIQIATLKTELQSAKTQSGHQNFTTKADQQQNAMLLSQINSLITPQGSSAMTKDSRKLSNAVRSGQFVHMGSSDGTNSPWLDCFVSNSSSLSGTKNSKQ